MIEESDIFYCGSLLPWAEWVYANQDKVSGQTIKKASEVLATHGEIWIKMSDAEFRARMSSHD